VSKRTKLTRFDVLAQLRIRINIAGSLRQYAKALDVSPAYLSDVMRGNRDPGPKVLAALGFRKCVTPAVIHYEVDR
jgi:transcriptional regulator with XRE-family HTH domain